MLALYKEGGALARGEVARPVPKADEVVIRVAVAGVCRTDIDVADGRIDTAEPLILGHEFSGWLESTGSLVGGLAVGQAVAIFPQFACGQCHACNQSKAGAGDYEVPCWSPEILGLNRHGAFAEQVAVPASSVVAVSAHTPMRHLAYAEPVAAALGSIPSDLDGDAVGVVIGINRIARLTEMLLRQAGFANIVVLDEAGLRDIEANTFDFAVEARATSATMAHMVRTVRPGGLILLKSRSSAPLSLAPGNIVRKRLTLRGVLYGSFAAAVALIERGALDLDALLAPTEPLDRFESVFSAARTSETQKQMFVISED